MMGRIDIPTPRSDHGFATSVPNHKELPSMSNRERSISRQLTAPLLLSPLFFAMAFLASCAHAPAAKDGDFKTAISRGDLDYTSPATRSEEGIPVGNGRMGSLV